MGKPALKLHWCPKVFWLLCYSQHIRMLLLSVPPPEEGERGALLHFQFWFGLSYTVLK